MPELPNTVTRKLRERELRPDASHPDADLLTAFLERGLPERDRGTVLSHLADCASCRDVVALAQPTAAEPSAIGFPKPAPSGLFFLRWGTLAVCAVLAVSVAVLHQRQPAETPLEAKNRISEPMSEHRSEPAASAKAVFGDENKSDESKGDGGKTDMNQSVPAVPAGGPQRKRESEPPVTTARRYDPDTALGIDTKTKSSLMPLSRGPAPMKDSAGFVANGAMVGGNATAQNFGLPLNGRSFNQLVQLKPGAVAGAQVAAGAGTGASDAVQPSAVQASVAETAPDVAKAAREKLAGKDERDDALRKSVASPSASAMAGPSSKSSEGILGALPSAPAPVAGEVRGVVVDPLGAAVSGAKVTITNTATGASLASSTNEGGNYDVPSVPAGPYTIAISKPGFQEFVRQGLNVEPSTVALNATLQVGAVAETVTVEAQAQSMDTVSATTSPTTAYGSNDKDAFRASSAEIANLPNMVAARPAGTWQITSAGNLQRSFDGGKSWESVPIVQFGINQPGANRPGRLRVIAATGFQVWVGGNGGVLLHSRDAGGHFTSVKVHRKQATLTGDIVALTFPDGQHGRLETADHDVWTTSDGGKTWRPSASVK